MYKKKLTGKALKKALKKRKKREKLLKKKLKKCKKLARQEEKKSIKKKVKKLNKKLKKIKKERRKDTRRIKKTRQTHEAKKNQEKNHKHEEKDKSSKGSRKKQDVVENGSASIGPSIDLMTSNQSTMTPMTREEWEKQESVVRRVYDQETGRHRLIKGSGEVLEECVSRDRHRAINKVATQNDGEFFQANIKSRASKP